MAQKIEKKKEFTKFVKSYDYLDEYGNLLFQKVRYVDQDGKKTFKQRRPGPNGDWIYSLGDIPKVLYNLPEVINAKKEGYYIWLVEGEKDADTLMDLGVVATTMPGGAGKWLDIHTDALRGAHVQIVADNDEPGRKHAEMVAKELLAAGCSVDVWQSPTSKDITDHFASGGTIDSLIPFEEGSSSEIHIEEHQEDELSAEEVTLEALQSLLLRDDLSIKQKLAKSSAILSTSGSQTPLDPGRLVLWDEFLKESEEDSYDWLIPGLLERNERVIVVAAEGVGKTMLARQVAICSACGINPFTYQQMKPIRTLTVDLENPERIIRRTSRSIMSQALHRSSQTKPLIHLYTKPSGLDLLKPGDRVLLEEQIEIAKPEMIVMGPLYKSFVDPGNRTSEAVAVEVAKYLDYLRTAYNVALWLEHHAPLGTSMTSRDLRPFGSAVWSRWPEFGISLTPDFTASAAYIYDLKHFRGARDERNWPVKLTRGKIFPFEVLEFSKIT
jgi:5S rRNA maturation endonuclease (ribonuclease M5)